MEKILQIPWQVPFGAFSLTLDPLSLVFLIAITVLVIAAGIYGIGYMRYYVGKKPLGLHAFFYVVLAMSLVLIVLANNVILFLGIWEVMSLATFFLIVFHDEKATVRRAGFLYLVATHCGTFCLFIMFFLLAHSAGSMNFDAIARTDVTPAAAGVIFLLAVAGFGVKAGFLPMHIWLPHAHPAAPSHVSALLSGVAIKTGIYGICRVLWMVGTFPDWCGYVLIGIGAVSGVMGVLYALGQHELKKLLAYHSIENIGIITLGLGVGLLGNSHHMPLLAVIGFGGGLLHVVNHSLFKGLLFLGAGAVIQRTGTGDMDQLGGLARMMPIVSGAFLIGALAICGLPLFNGFISEFIIFFGLFQGLISMPLAGISACVVGILALALIGALALACFTKVYGTVFSGEWRGEKAFDAKARTSRLMLIPMVVLAGLCVWIGFAPQTMAVVAFAGGSLLTHVDPATVPVAEILTPLTMVVCVACIFLGLVVAMVAVRRMLLRTSVQGKDTWCCAFSQVSPRMQYTSSSFARPIIDFMSVFLRSRHSGGHIAGVFPGKSSHVSSSVEDASEEVLVRPLFIGLTNLSKKIDSSRSKHTQLYLMYIFLFVMALLIWKLT